MKLIDLLAADWDPSRYRDAFREQVLGLIESKAAGAGVVREEEPAAPTAGVADLMAALQASVESAKKKTSGRAAKAAPFPSSLVTVGSTPHTFPGQS